MEQTLLEIHKTSFLFFCYYDLWMLLLLLWHPVATFTPATIAVNYQMQMLSVSTYLWWIILIWRVVYWMCFCQIL